MPRCDESRLGDGDGLLPRREGLTGSFSPGTAVWGWGSTWWGRCFPRGSDGTGFPVGSLPGGSGSSWAGCGGVAHWKGAPLRVDSGFSA